MLPALLAIVTCVTSLAPLTLDWLRTTDDLVCIAWSAETREAYCLWPVEQIEGPRWHVLHVGRHATTVAEALPVLGPDEDALAAALARWSRTLQAPRFVAPTLLWRGGDAPPTVRDVRVVATEDELRVDRAGQPLAHLSLRRHDEMGEPYTAPRPALWQLDADHLLLAVDFRMAYVLNPRDHALKLVPLGPAPRCPKRVGCPPSWPAIRPFLEQVCADTFDAAALARLNATPGLARDDLAVLANAYGAFHGHGFLKRKELNVLFYDEDASTWLPPACPARIRSVTSKAGLSASMKQAHRDIQAVYRAAARR